MEFPEGLQKQNVINLNLRFIQACGYLREDSAIKRRILVFCMVVIKYVIPLIFVTFLVGASVELYRLGNNPHDTGESIVFIITITKTMVKLVSLSRNKNEYLHLIRSFSDIYIHGKYLTTKQSSVLKSYFSEANKLIKLIWFLSTIMIFAFVGKVTPPEVGEREFVPAWESSSRVTIPFQTAHTPLYVLRVIYATAVTVMGFFVTTILNTFGFLLVIYLTAQFALLAQTLKDAAENVVEIAGKAERVLTFDGELTFIYSILLCVCKTISSSESVLIINVIFLTSNYVMQE
jgi:hypothetical protein